MIIAYETVKKIITGGIDWRNRDDRHSTRNYSII